MHRYNALHFNMVIQSLSPNPSSISRVDCIYITLAVLVLHRSVFFVVAVPVHVDVTSNRPAPRDLKVIEENLAIKLAEFSKTLSEGTGTMEKKREHYEKIKDLWLEMELNGIRYLSSRRGDSVAVYLWCSSRSSMVHLCRMRDSGDLGFLLEETMKLLAEENDTERLSFSLKVIDKEWNLAKCYFQASGLYDVYGDRMFIFLLELLYSTFISLLQAYINHENDRSETARIKMKT